MNCIATKHNLSQIMWLKQGGGDSTLDFFRINELDNRANWDTFEKQLAFKQIGSVFVMNHATIALASKRVSVNIHGKVLELVSLLNSTTVESGYHGDSVTRIKQRPRGSKARHDVFHQTAVYRQVGVGSYIGKP